MSRAFQSVRDLLGHIGFIVLGEYRVRLEGAAWIERAFRYDALPLAEQIRQHALIIDRDAGPAIKRTDRLLPRTTVPFLTSPPSLMRVPAGTCFSTTSLGELKKTIESRSALSISETANATTAIPLPIKTRRRCLRVIAAPISILRARVP